MSRHKSKTAAGVIPSSRHPAIPSPKGPELLRRSLVVLVTALIVARPLLLGEDPGLLDPFSDATGLVLTLLWLVAAVGWAGWRLWLGQGVWQGGLVEAGLLAAAGCYFLSAGFAAKYHHPAWLIASEWLVLVVCLSLVRQLAGTAETRRGLLAAVLATGVSLAAYGVYQYVVILPAQRSAYQNREELRKVVEREEGRPVRADDPELALLTERAQQTEVFATFANPNSYAGYLVLLLPAVAGYAVVAWRRRDAILEAVTPVVAGFVDVRSESRLGSIASLAAAGVVVVALVAAALMGAAVVLTHSRGAYFAVVLVAAVLALGFGRVLWRNPGWAAAGLAAVAVAGACIFLMPTLGTVKRAAGQSLSLRLNYWKATWSMIHAHPWLGVGPGSFGRYYPRYMVPTAVNEKISDPHNFVLDVWANAGWFALFGLLVALGAFAGRLATAAWDPAGVPHDPPPGPEAPPPWDFYLGGMVGLVLAFGLRAAVADGKEAILIGGVEAGLRSVVWFAAFALFWTIPWSGPSVVVALAAGVAACLLNLCVSGGIAFPSVAQPLWTVVALALALAAACAPGRVLRPGLGLFLPVPALAAVALTYFVLALLPAQGCDGYLRLARDYQEAFRTVTRSRDPKDRPKAVRLLGLATDALRKAHQADPANVTPLLRMALWDLETISPTRGGPADALRTLEQARELDPEGKEVRLRLFQVRLQLLARAEKDRPTRLREAREAADAVAAIDPSEAARLDMGLAETCFQIKDLAAGYGAARRAWDEDQKGRERDWPAYQLSPELHQKVRRWIVDFEAPFRLQVGPVLASAPQGPLQLLPALHLKPLPRPPRSGPRPHR